MSQNLPHPTLSGNFAMYWHRTTLHHIRVVLADPTLSQTKPQISHIYIPWESRNWGLSHRFLAVKYLFDYF